MKLLFDQNISFRIVKLLANDFMDCKQVKMLGLEDKSDFSIWEYAKQNDYVIVTFDADFADISYVRGTPPKIIWLRVGNKTTKSIAEILIENKNLIMEFIQSKDLVDVACLEIG